MLENMHSIMQRINEIQGRFGLRRGQQENHPQRNFAAETATRIAEQENRNSVTNDGNPINVDNSISAIKEIVRDYADQNRVPASLVSAIIETESSYNPRAVSNRGAMGLMQLMPETARELGVDDPFIPEENIRGGVSIIRRLLEKYNWDYKKALAAYNAGENVVDRSGGVPPLAETREYVNRVINAYLRNSE